MSETAIETVVEPTALARPEDVGMSIETLVARVEKIKEVQKTRHARRSPLRENPRR